MLGGNRSESGTIILYSTSEEGYLILALYTHALLLYKTWFNMEQKQRQSMLATFLQFPVEIKN